MSLDLRTERQLAEIVARWSPEEFAKKYTTEERRKLAGEGKAMSDLSFPIVDAEDLDNAIHLARTDPQRQFIKRRAAALGASGKIPDTWAAAVPAHDRTVTGLIAQAVKAQEGAPDPDDPNDKAVLQHLRNAAAAQDADNKGHAGGASY